MKSKEENEARKAYLGQFAEWERENQFLVAQPGDEWLGDAEGAIPLQMYN